MQKHSNLFKPIIIILIFLSLFLLFFKLSSPPLQRWDEQTNYQVVEESMNRSDWWNLTLNGEPFFEKPPVWYWTTIVISKSIGLNNLSVRLVSAVSGVLFILAMFFIGKKLFSFWGGTIASFCILATRQLFTSSYTFLFSTHTFRSADLDSLQLLFFILTFLFLYKSLANPKNLYFAAVFTALGFLTKGPFALLPILIFCIYLTINRKKRLIKFKYLVQAFLIFLIATLPWHIHQYVQYKNEFIEEYFLYHMIGRSVETLENHKGGLLYYFNILNNSKLFVSFELFVLSFIYALRTRKTNVDKFIRLSLTLGTFLVLIILTIIRTKLAWYIFYLYPFAFLLIGYLFVELSKKSFSKYLKIILLSMPILFIIRLSLYTGNYENLLFIVVYSIVVATFFHSKSNRHNSKLIIFVSILPILIYQIAANIFYILTI